MFFTACTHGCPQDLWGTSLIVNKEAQIGGGVLNWE